jgi:hypothetical protein
MCAWILHPPQATLCNFLQKSVQTSSIERQIAFLKLGNPFRRFQFISWNEHLSIGYGRFRLKNSRRFLPWLGVTILPFKVIKACRRAFRASATFIRRR